MSVYKYFPYWSVRIIAYTNNLNEGGGEKKGHKSKLKNDNFRKPRNEIHRGSF